jgi:hypothetical protein
MGIFALDYTTFNLRATFESWIENIVIQTELKQLKFEYEIDSKIP